MREHVWQLQAFQNQASHCYSKCLKNGTLHLWAAIQLITLQLICKHSRNATVCTWTGQGCHDYTSSTTPRGTKNLESSLGASTFHCHPVSRSSPKPGHRANCWDWKVQQKSSGKPVDMELWKISTKYIKSNIYHIEHSFSLCFFSHPKWWECKHQLFSWVWRCFNPSKAIPNSFVRGGI